MTRSEETPRAGPRAVRDCMLKSSQEPSKRAQLGPLNSSGAGISRLALVRYPGMFPLRFVVRYPGSVARITNNKLADSSGLDVALNDVFRRSPSQL